MRIKFILFQIAFLIIILSSFLFNIYEHNKSVEKQAINVVQTLIEKDIALRAWIAEKGGIYVKVSENTQPSEHLKFIKNRDLYVNDLNLTLMNPAFVLREVLQKYDSQLVNAKTKLTSKKYLNIHNKPNDWEIKALDRLEQKKSEFVYEFVSIKEKPKS